MTRLELAILRSVVYAGLFDYPLSLEQLRETLVESSASPDEILAAYRGSEALQSVVECRDGWFFPSGRVDLIAERRRREARSRAFLARHQRLLRLVCALPFTRMVALSGSIAHLNLEEGGDLDLFIVARGHRVWTVTVTTILLTKLLGLRRVACANFVISDLQLTLDQQDLFTANQVIHLQPIIGADLLPALLAANPFVRRVYPNAIAKTPVIPQLSDDASLKRVAESVLAVSGPAIEAVCRRAYGWYLRKRSSSWRSPEQVLMQADYLKLHTQSHRHSVLERFSDAVEDALRHADRRRRPAAAAGRR